MIKASIQRRQCLRGVGIAGLAALLSPPWLVWSADAPPQTEGASARLDNWPRQVLRLVVKYQQNPLRAARALAYTTVALREGWHASGEAGAHTAAALVLAQLYPHESAGQFAVQAHALRLQAGAASDSDTAAGDAVGRRLVERSLRDGAGRVWSTKLRPAPFPGIWLPTPPLYAANPTEGMAPHWRPWHANDASALYDPPRALRPGEPGHQEEVVEVLEARRQLTAAQRDAAWFWNLDAGSVTPAGVWLQLALQALAEHPEIGTAARLKLLAALSAAMHDAFVHCWRIKLRDWSERPVTAIRRTLDPGFEPLLVTPGFPGYVSGHATVSAAAAEVLGQHFPAQQAHWRERAEEAAMSRLWGGIHYRSDNEQGARLGRSVAQAVLAQTAHG